MPCQKATLTLLAIVTTRPRPEPATAHSFARCLLPRHCTKPAHLSKRKTTFKAFSLLFDSNYSLSRQSQRGSCTTIIVVGSNESLTAGYISFALSAVVRHIHIFLPLKQRPVKLPMQRCMIAVHTTKISTIPSHIEREMILPAISNH